MIKEIGEAVLKSDAKTLEEALLLPSSEGTIADLIVAKTSKIGEKLSLRRLEVVEKLILKILALTYIWAVRLLY